MDKNIDRQEHLRLVAEKVRQKKEQEAREEKEFYERVTSGKLWLFFKVVVVFCTLMAITTLIDVLFDGPTKKLSEKSWRMDHTWRYSGHAILDVEGYMFTPKYLDWGVHIENTIELTYTPIFRTGKKLRFDSLVNGDEIERHVIIRNRSIFTWFPFLQIFLLIPLATFIFKRQSPWFNFARIVSFVFVFPGTLMVLFFAIY